MADDEYATCRIVSLANLPGPGQGDVVAILEKAAAWIRQQDAIYVHHVSVRSDEVTEHGEWWSASIYFDNDPRPRLQPGQ